MSLRICTSEEPPGGADDAGPEITRGKLLVWRFHLNREA